MKKLIFIVLFHFAISVQSQNVFGYDSYDTLKIFIIKFNREICQNKEFQGKTVFSGDSLFSSTWKKNKNSYQLTASKKGNVNLRSIIKGNKFEIEIFDMTFTGVVNKSNANILEFFGYSKGIKFKVSLIDGQYQLTPLKFKKKNGNEKQLEDMRKNLSTLVAFVNSFLLIPPESCK